MKHEGGRVEPAKRPVEADWLAVVRRREALAGNNLEDVAGLDVIAAGLDNLEIARLACIRLYVDGFFSALLGRNGCEAFEAQFHLVQQSVYTLPVFLAPDKHKLLIQMVKDDHDTGNQQQGFGHAQYIGLGDDDRFDILDHVVAEVAKSA